MKQTMTLEEKITALIVPGIMPVSTAQAWLGWSGAELDRALNAGRLGAPRFVGGRAFVQQGRVRDALLAQQLGVSAA